MLCGFLLFLVVHVSGNRSVAVSNVIFMISMTTYDIVDYLEIWQDFCFLLENRVAFIIQGKKKKKKRGEKMNKNINTSKHIYTVICNHV